jgi:hypothetical protein
MSVLFKTRTIAVSGLIRCVCASLALAQQTQTGHSAANPSGSNESNRSASGPIVRCTKWSLDFPKLGRSSSIKRN